MGFYQVGYNVVGVDVVPQRNYPFEFHQADAVTFLAKVIARRMQLEDGRRIAVIAAHPPCQRWSRMTHCRPGLAEEYPDLISPIRELLVNADVPWVMENVVGSPLRDPIMLCGQMFGLELYRHRLFESNMPIIEPPHPEHTMPASKAGHWVPGTIMSVCGHVAPVAKAREIMEISWTTRDELDEAIPPAYTRYVGKFLLWPQIAALLTNGG